MDKYKIYEYIHQTAHAKPEDLVAVSGGLSDCAKYKVSIGGTEWMAKLLPGTPLRALWYTELQKRCSDQMANPKLHHLFDDGTLCLLSPWIRGDSLETRLSQATAEEAQAYGRQAAQLLLHLHQLPFPYAEYSGTLTKRIRNACEQISRLGLRFPGYEACCGYLKQAAESTQVSHLCFVHKDIRPENFIVQGDRLYLIDFDNGSLGERAADFSYSTTMGRKDHQLFSGALIRSYLQTIQAEDFWEKNLLYSTLQLVEYAIWKWNTKGKQVCLQAQNFIEQYDHFRSPQPKWFKLQK